MPILLAERFGGGPLLYDEYPLDRRQHYLAMLAVESRVVTAFADLGPDDELSPDFFD